MPGCYYYKKVSRAGQPGMKVAYTMSMDSELPVIAFAENGTRNSDAFVVVNTSLKLEKLIEIEVKGSNSIKFRIYRTTGNGENYSDAGEAEVTDGKILYRAPVNSVTTFFAVK